LKKLLQEAKGTIYIWTQCTSYVCM